MAHTIIGTAGHIDHGKTLLVKALTGMETDRAPEEKARGITIELGFAFYGDRATIIDVPGHERFVKTMVAGVSTIDLGLLVIAADDGVMPQSREHLDVLQLMGVKRGLVLLNKIDMVDEEWLTLVEDDVRQLVQGTFLQGAPILPVSALSGTGIDEVKATLDEMIEATEERQEGGPFRLPVDRSFVVKGFGLVNTGTVLSGRLQDGDSVEVLPAGRPLRVRGLQQHGQSVPAVASGDRAAVNLPGVEHGEIERGDVLATVGFFQPTHMLDGRLQLLNSAPRELVHRARVRLHVGTSEVMARVILLDRSVLEPGSEGMVQLHLEKPVVAVWGDRFAIRSYSPALTIGGGAILEPHPTKHRRSDSDRLDRLARLEAKSPAQLLEAKLENATESALPVQALAGALGYGLKQVTELLEQLSEAGGCVLLQIEGQPHAMHQKEWKRAGERVRTGLQSYHEANPLKRGLKREELRSLCARYLQTGLFERLLASLEESGEVALHGSSVHLASHNITLTAEQQALAADVEKRLRQATFAEMPGPDDLTQSLNANRQQIDQLLGAMQSLGSVTALEGGLLLHSKTVSEVRSKLLAHLQGKGEITVSAFRDLIDGNRKYALALLAHFDRIGFTERQGDVRVLRA